MLIGLILLPLGGGCYFEAFCTGADGGRYAVEIPEWLPLNQLFSLVSHECDDMVSFGMREMVRTPLGVEWEKTVKVWKLAVVEDGFFA